MGKVQFPLVNLRKDTVNKWHLEHIPSESVEIPEIPNEWGFYSASLSEIPSDGSIDESSPPKIAGFTQYRGDPINSKTGNVNFSQNQFYVNYQTGELLFHQAQAGQTVSVDYYAKGSLIEVEDINWLFYKIQDIEKLQYEPKFISFECSLEKIFETGQMFPSQEESTPAVFTWTIEHPELLEPDSIYITAGMYRIASGISPSSTGITVNVPQIQASEVPGEIEVSIHATGFGGREVKSSFPVKWVDRIYYGTSIDKTNSQEKVKFSSSVLLPSAESSQEIDLTLPLDENAYKMISVPMRYAVKHVKDANSGLQFVFNDPSEISIENKYGLSIPYLTYFSANRIESAAEIKLNLGA